VNAETQAGAFKNKNIYKQLKIELGGMIMLPVFKNSWFPTVFDDFMNNDMMACSTTTAPAVNVKEDENAYTMEVAAPGIKKEYCRVNINDDGNLSIAIENKMEHKEENKKQHYLRREFSYTNYQQNYSLPEDVNKEQISAKVDNGILTVVLPKMKKEETKVSRMIEIS
jgi:HSP20 family protein